MTIFRRQTLVFILALTPISGALWAADTVATNATARSKTDDQSWPPALKGAVNGTVTVSSSDFLKIPESVRKSMKLEGAAPFIMAKRPPTVELAYHGNLPDRALNGTGWSAWGDICVASDGKVYSGIGDHGDDVGGAGHTYIYCWDPSTKTLKQVADANKVAGVQSGDPSFSKVHARIFEGKDRKIYFSCTLNDGGTSAQVKWTPRIPGGLIYQYDPQSEKTAVIGNMPRAATATTLLDYERNILYCCLEGKIDPPSSAALAAFDLEKPGFVYESAADEIVADRNMALDKNGVVYFNGKGGKLWKYDPRTTQISPTGIGFPKLKDEGVEAQPTMRSSTIESKDGWIYGTTMGPGRLFRYRPSENKIELLGPDFLQSEYTTVTVLSPDERFLYYLPGSHGSAFKSGTPVIQYEIATGQRKILAFLQPVFEKQHAYVPSGTYGVKLSADGSTLYVNFNGHARNDVRPDKMLEIGFGLTSFAAIHIPESER